MEQCNLKILQKKNVLEARKPNTLKATLFSLGNDAASAIRDQPFFWGLFCRVVETTQLFHFAFQSIAYHSFRFENISLVFRRITDSLAVYPWLLDFSDTVRVSFVYFMAALCFLALLLLMLGMINSTRAAPLVTAATYITSLLNSIFYVPILGMFCLSLRCEESEGKWTHYLWPEAVCYSSVRMDTTILSIIGIGVIILVATLSRLLFSEIRINFNNVYSQNRLAPDMIFHAVRTVLLIFFVLIPTINSKGVYVVIYFAVSCFIFFQYCGRVTFYSLHVEYILRFLHTLGVWISLASVLEAIFDENVSYMALGGILFLGPLFTVVISTTGHRKIFKELVVDTEQYHSGTDSFIHLFRVLNFSKTENSYYINIYKIFLHAHIAKCDAPNCPIISTLIVKKDQGVGLREIYGPLLIYICRRLQRTINLYPLEMDLTILYASFLLDYMGNYFISGLLLFQYIL